MPPNNKQVLFNFDQAALPYNEPAYKNISRGFSEEREDASQSSEESASDRVQEDFESSSNLRVTTRARRSYELDRYTKNAMLIIDNKQQLNSSYHDYTVKEAFERYRFEVESHENISRDEIIAVCERFFQKDFSEYGAVAVAIMADVNVHHLRYEARDSSFTENDVLKFLTTNQPPSLQGKPKISIVERYLRRSPRIPPLAEAVIAAGPSASLVWKLHNADASDYFYDKRRPIQHPDYLRFHIPITLSIYSSHPSFTKNKLLGPIQMLSKDIMEKADGQDFYTLMVSSAVKVAKTINIFRRCPIKIESTLKKDLILYSNDTS